MCGVSGGIVMCPSTLVAPVSAFRSETAYVELNEEKDRRFQQYSNLFGFGTSILTRQSDSSVISPSSRGNGILRSVGSHR